MKILPTVVIGLIVLIPLLALLGVEMTAKEISFFSLAVVVCSLLIAFLPTLWRKLPNKALFTWLIILISLPILTGSTPKEFIIFVVSILVGGFIFFILPIIWVEVPKLVHAKFPQTERALEKLGRRLKNIFCFPFRLLWNLFVTFLIIKAFIIWYGFIFGSVVGVILIYIFVPHLFGLPLWLVHWYTGFWKDESDDELWNSI
jgi:hypothetical protein